MNSPPNFSLIASTSGLVQGSCCGPLGFAGAAGFAPGGGGGGLGAAAFGSPAGGGGGGVGFGGSAAFSAGLSVCWLSFCSSATFSFSEGTGLLRRAAATQRRGFNHTLR